MVHLFASKNEYEENLYPYGRMHNVAQSTDASNLWSFPHKVEEQRLSSAITVENITCVSVMCNWIFHISDSDCIEKKNSRIKQNN